MLSVIKNYFKNKFTKPVEEPRKEPTIASISTVEPTPIELPKEESVAEEPKVKKTRTRKKK